MNAMLMPLVLHFMALSLIAFGGAGALTPEIYRVAVDQQHWLTAREFVDLFAIAQASPGPNVLFITLIGWKVAGIPGALASTLAMCIPGSVLTYFVARLWQRFRDHPLRQRIQQALVPLTVGLVGCTAWVMIRLVVHSMAAIALTVASTLFALRTSLNPLWVIAIGAGLGVAGYI